MGPFGPNVSLAAADIRAVIAEIEEFREGRTLGDDLAIRQLIEEGRRS